MIDLPWQLDILLAEIVISATIGAILLVLAPFQRTPVYGFFWGAVDATMLALLLWAGSSTWQHFLYAGFLLATMITQIIKGLNRDVIEPVRMGLGGIAFWSVAIASFFGYLVIGGAS